LYKMLFDVTPFEDGGKLKIINAQVDFPPTSKYSQNIHALIKLLLNPDPYLRPDIDDTMIHTAKLLNITHERHIPKKAVRDRPDGGTINKKDLFPRKTPEADDFFKLIHGEKKSTLNRQNVSIPKPQVLMNKNWDPFAESEPCNQILNVHQSGGFATEEHTSEFKGFFSENDFSNMEFSSAQPKSNPTSDQFKGFFSEEVEIGTSQPKVMPSEQFKEYFPEDDSFASLVVGVQSPQNSGQFKGFFSGDDFDKMT